MLPKSDMKKYLNLFFTMLKIGLFSFGGGYAMIALLENEFVSKKKWMEKDEFIDMVAIAESTPGPVAINSATYIGYKLLGFWGAFLATIAVCIPSFAIIFVISLFFDAFLTLTLVSYAFRGIQACVIYRSEEHMSELQSRGDPDLVCRLLLEKKKTKLLFPA